MESPSFVAALRSATMTGSSIAAPGAALWVTDFLNAAYYARVSQERTVDDLRLARAILATRWATRPGRRLGARDLPAFHRAFGRARLRTGEGAERGRLSRDDLLRGAAALIGDWFQDAWADPARRGHGIAFPDADARAAFLPESRLRRTALQRLAPPRAPAGARAWHTYPPVPVRSAAATAAALRDPARWPDFGSALGVFVPVRSGGLAGQTFEIEIVLLLAARAPVQSRGYVTATRVLEVGGELDAFARMLNQRLAAAGAGEALPVGGRPLLGVELTTHAGHFLGRATSNLLLFEHAGATFVRDVGQWDPLPLHLDVAYRRGGAEAQAAFWGAGAPDDSMLHQFAAA